MKELHLITVGKLKVQEFKTLEQDYLKRLKLFKLSLHELKGHQGNLELESQIAYQA